MQEGSNIAELGILYEPDPVQFSFDTVGWKVLFSLLIVFMLGLIIKLSIRYIKNAYRREALKMLSMIKKRYYEKEEARCISDTSILLKQVALKSYGRKKVAELHSSAWIDFLNESAPKVDFTSSEKVISKALYENKNSNNEAVRKYFDQAEKWIKRHA